MGATAEVTMNPEEQALIDQLGDVIAPQVPGWWPLAVGWWVLLALVLGMLIGLFFIVRNFKNKQRKDRWRKEALIDHQRISNNLASRSDTDINQSTELAELSVLMRRVALALLPRERVAAMTDDDWLETLDVIGNTREYSHGVGQWLCRGPYRRSQYFDPRELGNLLELTETTIKQAQPVHQAHQEERAVAAL